MASARNIEIGQHKRLAIVGFVRAFNADNHHGPTHDEIAQAIGVSHVRAHQLVQELIDSGKLIRRRPGQRTLQVVPEA